MSRIFINPDNELLGVVTDILKNTPSLDVEYLDGLHYSQFALNSELNELAEETDKKETVYIEKPTLVDIKGNGNNVLVYTPYNSKYDKTHLYTILHIESTPGIDPDNSTTGTDKLFTYPTNKVTIPGNNNETKYVRVRYVSKYYRSPWSDEVEITLSTHSNMDAMLNTNVTNTAYGVSVYTNNVIDALFNTLDYVRDIDIVITDHQYNVVWEKNTISVLSNNRYIIPYNYLPGPGTYRLLMRGNGDEYVLTYTHSLYISEYTYNRKWAKLNKVTNGASSVTMTAAGNTHLVYYVGYDDTTSNNVDKIFVIDNENYGVKKLNSGLNNSLRDLHIVQYGNNDNKILTFGGRVAGTFTPITTTKMVDISTDTVAVKNNMPVGVYSGSAGYDSHGDYIVVVGGKDSNGNWLKTVQLYNINTNTWTTTTDFPLSIGDAAVTIKQGIIYVIGGWYLIDGYTKTSDFIYHKPINGDTWIRGAKLDTEIQAAFVNNLDDEYVLLSGGNIGDSKKNNGMFLVNVVTGETRLIGVLPEQLYDHAVLATEVGHNNAPSLMCCVANGNLYVSS